MNKYEVAPGLYVGSEMGDLNRELKVAMKELLEGDEDAMEKINANSRRRFELLMPKKFSAHKDT